MLIRQMISIADRDGKEVTWVAYVPVSITKAVFNRAPRGAKIVSDHLVEVPMDTEGLCKTLATLATVGRLPQAT